MTENQEAVTTTRKIDKTTYVVVAFTSEKAKDTLDKKIEKLIIRDIRKSTEETRNI